MSRDKEKAARFVFDHTLLRVNIRQASHYHNVYEHLGEITGHRQVGQRVIIFLSLHPRGHTVTDSLSLNYITASKPCHPTRSHGEGLLTKKFVIISDLAPLQLRKRLLLAFRPSCEIHICDHDIYAEQADMSGFFIN